MMKWGTNNFFKNNILKPFFVWIIVFLILLFFKITYWFFFQIIIFKVIVSWLFFEIIISFFLKNFHLIIFIYSFLTFTPFFLSQNEFYFILFFSEWCFSLCFVILFWHVTDFSFVWLRMYHPVERNICTYNTNLWLIGSKKFEIDEEIEENFPLTLTSLTFLFSTIGS